MTALGPDAHDEYTQLKEEDKYVQGLIQKKEMEVENIEMGIERLTKRMQEPDFLIHRKGMEMKKRKLMLEKQHQELIEETSSNLSPAQMQDKLKDKLARLQTVVENAEKTQKLTEQATEKLQEAIQQKETEMADAKAHKRRAEKYEVLYTKDAKIQEFIDSYPKFKDDQSHQKKQLEKTIVMLLQHISKNLAAQTNLPDQSKFEELKSELSFKESRIKHSKSTLQKLEVELAQRKEEIEKINGLDKKITLELQMFKKKITDMRREAKGFKTTEQLNQEAKIAKAELSQNKIETAKRREQVKAQVQLLSHNVERKKRELNSSESMKRIDALQTKLRANTQSSFQLSEWIISRKREADWDVLRKQSLALTSDINLSHVKCNRGT
jgi:hypothetical protein